MGKIFYFCYPANAEREPEGIPPDPPSHFNGTLILTSSFNASGTVRNSSGTVNIPFTIPANSVITISIDSTNWIARSELIYNKGLKIEADTLITAYFLSYEDPGATNDMALLFPKPSLGTDYMVMCWRDNIPTYPLGGIPMRQWNRGPSMFAITATENNTEVSITPAVNTEGGMIGGNTYTFTMNEYQCCQVLANTPSATYPLLYDLTGSRITSDKPISVIAGSQISFVPDSVMAADYLIEMVPPLTAWGNNFNLFPIQPRNSWNRDVLRILASEDGTSITITDGSGVTPVSLDAGEYFEWNGQPCYEGSYIPFFGEAADCDGKMLDSPTHITSDKPILVGQYITGGTLTRGEPDFLTGSGDPPLGDPAFMLVPPEEQYARRYIFLTPNGYNNDFLNVAIPSGSEGTITLDGAAPTYSTPWFDIPVSGYRGARISLEPGSHILEADTEILLQMYGYDLNWASYATIGGQNLLPINAEYQLVKYSLTPIVYTGTEATWRIVVYNFRGDPSTEITIIDSLPTGFTMSAIPPTYELYGAVRDSVLDPTPGNNIITFGYFSMDEGDSLVIIFTADVGVGVVGRFDNPFSLNNSRGWQGGNFGGRGPQDDVRVIAPEFDLDIIQPFDGAYVACIDQEIQMTIDIDVGMVDPASIHLEITMDGAPPETFMVDGSTLSFSGNMLTFDPRPGFYTSGETVYVCLTECADTHGYEMPTLPFCWEFYIDFDPPIAYDFNIEPGDTIIDAMQVITFTLFDIITGVDPTTLIITVNGTDFYPPAIIFEGDSIVIDPALLRLYWFDYEEVEICIYAEDSPDYCENAIDTCYYYPVLHSIPQVEIVMPLDSTITSCFDQEIMLYITDSLVDINPDSILLEVDGRLYTIGPYLTFTDSTLTFTPPPPGFENNDTIIVRLIYAENEIGTPPDSLPIEWVFFVDLEPPTFFGFFPPVDSIVYDSTPDIQLYITDNLAGVNPSSITVTLNGSSLSPSSFTFAESLLQLVGVRFTESGTVEVCVHAEDMPDYCPPNAADTCWRFIVALSVPEAYPEYPLPGEITACDPETIIIALYSEDTEINEESIELHLNGDVFTTSSPYLTYDPVLDQLVFAAPPGYFAGVDSVLIELINAEDEYGVNLPSPLVYTIYIDYEPPVFWNIIPPFESTISSSHPNISLSIFDSMAGVNESEILITINDTIEFRTTDPGVTWSPPNFAINTSTAGYSFTNGDTLTICVYAEDMPDYCGPNADTLCWEIYINLARPTAILLLPFDGAITSCADQNIAFQITSSNGVDESSIILLVEDSPYSTTDPELDYDPVTEQLIFTPSVLWSDWDTIEFCLTDLLDTLGHDLSDTVCGRFYVDLTPPTIYNIVPGPDSLLNDSLQTIQFCLYDFLAGIDGNTVTIIVNSDTFRLRLGTVTYDTCLTWNPVDHDIVFHNWDTVDVCVTADDAVDDYCDPNHLEHCWSFVVHTEGPVGEFITPEDGWYSACSDQGITFDITDDISLNMETVVLEVNGVEYTMDSTGLSFTGSHFTWIPSSDWNNGDTVTACITAAEDSIGNTLQEIVCITFIIDLQPPVVLSTVPTDGDSITTTTPVVIVEIFDSLSGLDSTTINITINGDPYAIPHPALDWSEPLLRIDFSALLYAFVGGDSVRICVFTTDLVDTCGPNEGRYCFTFFVSTGGPTATIIRPLDGTFSACTDEHIVLYLEDDDGVDVSTIELEITSNITGVSTYTVDGITLVWDDSLIFYPSPAWVDGETLTACLTAADDSIGNTLEEAPVCWTFYIDLSSPVFWNESPADGEVITDLSPIVSVNIVDLISGLDVGSIHFTIDAVDYYISHSAVSWDDETLSIDFAEAGIYLSGCDTIDICVHAEDIPDYCNPNVGDFCWTFYIACGGPVGIQIAPPASIYSSCEDQEIVIAIIDSNGVDESTIELEVGGDIYSYPDPHLTWAFDSLLTFVPDPLFNDGDSILVRLLSADDDLGNSLSGVLEWTFFIDLTPPVFSDFDPPFGSISTDSFQVICVSIYDSLSGLNEDSLAFIVNGIEYDLSSSALTWDGYTLCFHPESVGVIFHDHDTVSVCIPPQYDLAEICGPNSTDTTCWDFQIRLFGPVAEVIQYLDSTYVACEEDSQLLLITITDEDSIEEDGILLIVEEIEYIYDDEEVEFDGTTLSYVPSSPWVNGQVVDVELVSAPDIYESPLSNPLSWSFIMDLSPPEVSGIRPPIGSTVIHITEDIVFHINDLLSGLDRTSIVVTLNDISYPIDELIFEGDSVILSPESLGIFLQSDTNIVCVTANDLPDYCSPNILDTCWSFIVSTGGPIGEIIIPQPDSVTACEDQDIIIRLTDPDGVNDTTIRIRINDSLYLTTYTELTYDGEFLTFTPTTFWEHGDIVQVNLLEANDMLGNMLETPLSWSFIVDLEPPVISNINPVPGDTIASLQFDICFELDDDIAGMDTSSFLLIIDEEDYSINSGCYDYVITQDSTGRQAITHISLCDTCLRTLTGGDILRICLYVNDDPEYCGPNSLEYCWQYLIEPGGPIGSIIQPFDGAYSSCEVQEIIIYLHDDNGINTNSIIVNVDGIQYTFAEYPDNMSFENDTLILVIPDSVTFNDGDVVSVIVENVDDMLGNPLSVPLQWEYYIDYEGPTLEMLNPNPSTLISNSTPVIIIESYDEGSGFDENSSIFHITIGDTVYVYDVTDQGVNYLGSSRSYEINTQTLGLALYDTIWVEVTNALDTPDYCFPNTSSDSWFFIVERQTKCHIVPNPFTPNGDDYNDIIYFIYPKMYSQEAELKIYNLRNVLVYQETIPPQMGRIYSEKNLWDGKDSNGKMVPEGIYIYAITVDGKVVCNGTIVLAR
ncbi:gliding motility-associated C-terminal domain-containing protein [bacterium]|nr:gliding motility-associated C-terminal domain-containing protein [bacterium]